MSWGARTYVMAIVNVTPDSFSGDGLTNARDAIEHAITHYRLGADLLDIGGESTRPGHRQIDDRVEIERIVPVIQAVRERLAQAPISV
ncbi:MAG: dihydropteroate synthase, partial [Candidatus Eremiobacteraeota bacterium]|nr:dihydropteroate synthase [Candidatus Eremiobacteraeota bacterium]